MSGFWRTNLQGGVELIHQARLAGVERLVAMSSRAVFGQRSSSANWVDDDTSAVPDTHYGALKLSLEAHASAFSAVDGVCYCSLRPTGVYGVTHPVERTKWLDLALAMMSGSPLPTARLATEVHGRDVAAAVWLLLTAPAADVGGRAFNCSDLVLDSRTVMERLAERLNVGPELPVAAANELRNSMRTTALDGLGWRPGGEELLAKTLDRLAATARAHARVRGTGESK